MVLLSILKLLGIALNTALAAPLVVAAGAFNGRRAYHLARAWVRVNLWITGVRVHVRRETALAPHAPYVFMSNHQSHFDVLAVVAALPECQLRWIAKRELTRVPIFGWALRQAPGASCRPRRAEHLARMLPRTATRQVAPPRLAEAR